MTAAVIAAAAMEHGAWQDQAELAQAVQLAASTSPRVIVEIGCDSGGTLYAWTQICGRVYGITSGDNSPGGGGRGGQLDSHGADVLAGDSHDTDSWAWLNRALLGSPVDVLVIDGDHSQAGCRQDLADYGPLVRPGGLILVHDIHTRGEPGVQVPQVWAGLAGAYETGEITSPSGPGWGVIHVRAGDVF